MRRWLPASLSLVACLACAPPEPDEWIVGTWIIDEAAQREEVERVSPDELEDFEQAYRATLAPIRETFHRDGRYEVEHSLGGPFEDRWEVVSKDADSITLRSSGHSWIALSRKIREKNVRPSPSVLTYTFRDRDHMSVASDMPVFGETKRVSYFFVRTD